jgi:hypothetical protein
VEGTLEKGDGVKPTEMAVLLTAARDTIMDLAKAQVEQTFRKASTLDDEMLVVLRSQKARLKELGDQDPELATEALEETLSNGSGAESLRGQEIEKGLKQVNAVQPAEVDNCATQ